MKVKITDKTLNIIGILGILDTIFAVILKAGLNVGTMLPGFVGAILLIYVKFRDVFKNSISNEKYKWLKKILIAAASLWLVSFLIIEGFILSSAFSKSREKADYLVILGAGIDGKNITLALKQRLDKGIKFLKENPDVKVIVTGGQGFGEETTEAQAMREYLLKNNIDDKRIITENKATSTMENFKFTKEKLQSIDKKPSYKIMVITSEFHMFRAKILARRNGFTAYGISAHTPFYILPNCLIREYFAVGKSLVFDK